MISLLLLTDPHPAIAPGAMSLRKMEGPLGTADLPDPEAIREQVPVQEGLKAVRIPVREMTPEIRGRAGTLCSLR